MNMKRQSNKPKARKGTLAKSATTKVQSAAADKATSKHDAILALLRRPGGATIVALVDATGLRSLI
jgi:hypothetical protein